MANAIFSMWLIGVVHDVALYDLNLHALRVIRSHELISVCCKPYTQVQSYIHATMMWIGDSYARQGILFLA